LTRASEHGRSVDLDLGAIELEALADLVDTADLPRRGALVVGRVAPSTAAAATAAWTSSSAQ
jgi:hypothetical protein